ncbi:MAG: peptide-methionine (S)-S-oxide reductase MsrA, partial [Flavobacteriaceae bacterium]
MIQTAYFSAGCFWCTEAVFQRLKGVISVQSGYMGGTIKNPAYREVCQGRTGHAEGVEVQFDATEISYHTLVVVFFSSHDPTTLNRQGADVGT